jgi:hypothetical protein
MTGRRATISRAKLARAYASAGQPHEACQLAWDALDAIESVGSLSAHAELPMWTRRDDYAR